MKPIYRLAVAMLIFASLPLMAQQAGAGAQPNTPAAASGSQGRSPVTAAGADESRIAGHDLALAAGYLRPVSAVLEGKLDAKTAKPGDSVVVKTTRDTILADGTDVPKGSRLIGHVTAVQAHSKDHAESKLSFSLDRAELKNGISVPIHAMIQSITPPARAMAVGSMAAGDGVDSSMAGEASATPSGGGSAPMSGGGAVQGVGQAGGGPVGGAVGGVASAGSPASDTLGAPAGGALDGTYPVADTAAGPVDRGLAGIEAGSTANHATEIPDVMLRGYVTGSPSGTLSAAGKNVHLDSGTQMVLEVAAQ